MKKPISSLLIFTMFTGQAAWAAPEPVYVPFPIYPRAYADDPLYRDIDCQGFECQAIRFLKVLALTGTELTISWFAWREVSAAQPSINRALLNQSIEAGGKVREAQERLARAEGMLTLDEKEGRLEALEEQMETVKAHAQVGRRVVESSSSSQVTRDESQSLDEDTASAEQRAAISTAESDIRNMENAAAQMQEGSEHRMNLEAILQRRRAELENLRSGTDLQRGSASRSSSSAADAQRRAARSRASASSHEHETEASASDVRRATRRVEKIDEAVLSRPDQRLVDSIGTRMRRVIELPDVTPREKEVEIAAAKAYLSEIQSVYGGWLLKNIASKAIKVVAIGALVFTVLDASGRVVMYLCGRDPMQVPFFHVGRGSVDRFRRDRQDCDPYSYGPHYFNDGDYPCGRP